MNERRGRERCPVCQGPVKESKGQLRCRNSLCLSHHGDASPCPRCGGEQVDVSFVGEQLYLYSCPACGYQVEKKKP